MVKANELREMVPGHYFLPHERWFISIMFKRQDNRRDAEVNALFAATIVTMLPGVVIGVIGLVILFLSWDHGSVLTVAHWTMGVGVLLIIVSWFRLLQLRYAGRKLQENRPFVTVPNTMQEWTLRVGVEGATCQVKRKHYTLIATIAWYVALMVLVIVGSLHLPVLALFEVIPLTMVVVFKVLSLKERSRFKKICKVNFGSDRPKRQVIPPHSRVQYLQWCERYGLKPYPFKDDTNANNSVEPQS